MEIIHQDDWPEGLTLYKGIISKQEHDLFYEYINSLDFTNTLSRETKHFGYAYDYGITEPRTKILQKADKAPEVLQCIANILFEQNILKNDPNQIIINKYKPGQGIGRHRDHHPIFGSDIATLSLGSSIEMQFEPYKKSTSGLVKVYLPPGSILVFSGEARYDYSHEIKKRKSDIINGKKLARGDRISVTFRHVDEKYQGK